MESADDPVHSNLQDQDEKGSGNENPRSMSESVQSLGNKVSSTGQEALENIQTKLSSIAGRREPTTDERQAQESRPNSEEIHRIEHMDKTKVVEYLQEKHRSDK